MPKETLIRAPVEKAPTQMDCATCSASRPNNLILVLIKDLTPLPM